MMPIVRPAACAGAPRPDSTNGLAAAPPKKVLRERVLREMERVIIDNTPSLAAAFPPPAMGKKSSVRKKGLRRGLKARATRSSFPSSLLLGFRPWKLRDLGGAGAVKTAGIARQHGAEIETGAAPLIEQRALFDRAQMMIHDLDGGIRIAGA